MALDRIRTFHIAEKILYKDHDDRIDMDDLEGLPVDLKDAVIEQTKSIGCIIHKSWFDIDKVTGVHTLKKFTLKKRIKLKKDEDGKLLFKGYPLAHDEKFREQWAHGTGTVFAMDKGVSTAAHCVCKDESDVLDEQFIKDARIIFNYRVSDDGHLKTEYHKDEIYKIKKVAAHKYIKIKGAPKERIDWAWLKLNKPFNGKPLKIDFSPIDPNKIENRQVYAIGHPSGLPAKLATSSVIKDVTKNYFTTNLSMFGGNSGSPVFDRISKKVIGILFEGISPDYELVENYEGNGKHRIKARQATIKDIEKVGFEKCQLLGGIKVHIDQRIAWIAKNSREEMKKKSTQKSKIYREMRRDAFKGLNLQNIIGTAALFVPPFGTIYGALSRHFVAKDRAQLEKEVYSVKKITLSLDKKVNSLEAYYIYILNKDPIDKNSIKFARILSAYYNDGEGITVGFPDRDLREVDHFLEIENSFARKFSPTSIFKLMKYERKEGFIFTRDAREQILTYMHNDYENPESSVEKARIKACIKTTKREPAYRNWKRESIQEIAEHMVKESPRLTFEGAREELGYPKP